MSEKINAVSNVTLKKMLKECRIKKSKDPKAEKAIISHTGMGDDDMGSYFVPDEKMEHCQKHGAGPSAIPGKE